MTTPRRERAAAIADGAPLVSADPATVTWLTGVAVEIEWGPSPFSAAPVVVLFPAATSRWSCRRTRRRPPVRTSVPSPFPGSRSRMSTGRRRSSSSHSTRSVPAGPIAADLHALPGSLVAALGPGRLRDVRRALQDARAVKDPDEIEAIRAATEIADAGQAAARAGLRPGAD